MTMDELKEKFQELKQKTFRMFDSLLDNLYEKIQDEHEDLTKAPKFYMFIVDNLATVKNNLLFPTLEDMLELAIKNRDYLEYLILEAGLASDFVETGGIREYIMETLPDNLIEFFNLNNLSQDQPVPNYFLLYTIFFTGLCAYFFSFLTEAEDKQLKKITDIEKNLKRFFNKMFMDEDEEDDDEGEEEDEEAEEETENDANDRAKGFEIVIGITDKSLFDAFKEVLNKPELTKEEKAKILEIFYKNSTMLGTELLSYLKVKVKDLAKQFANNLT